MWVHLQLPPQHCCVSCFPIPNPEINHRDSSAGIPQAEVALVSPSPAPSPGHRSDATLQQPQGRVKGCCCSGLHLVLLTPIPARPFPHGAASLLFSGPVCLLHLLTRRSPAARLTHPAARGTARTQHTHLSPASSPVPRQALPQPSALLRHRDPRCPHTCHDGWHEQHKKPQSHHLCSRDPPKMSCRITGL